LVQSRYFGAMTLLFSQSLFGSVTVFCVRRPLSRWVQSYCLTVQMIWTCAKLLQGEYPAAE